MKLAEIVSFRHFEESREETRDTLRDEAISYLLKTSNFLNEREITTRFSVTRHENNGSWITFKSGVFSNLLCSSTEERPLYSSTIQQCSEVMCLLKTDCIEWNSFGTRIMFKDYADNFDSIQDINLTINIRITFGVDRVKNL